MGHYDSDYEDYQDRINKQNKKEAEKALKALRQAMSHLPEQTPERFVNAIEDFYNWVQVTYDAK